MDNEHQSSESLHLVAGRKPVLELLSTAPERVEGVMLQKGAKGGPIEQILDLCRQRGVRFRFVERHELDRQFPGNHQGVLADIFEAGYTELHELLQTARQSPLPLLVALDQVLDPGNVGALARTVHALGGAGLLVPKHNAARLGTGALKASAGALLRLPIARVTNLARALEECAEEGYTIYGTQGEAGENLFFLEPRLPAVIVLGGEEKGMRPGVAKRCDFMLRIPLQHGFDSLNVAQAGALITGHFARAKALRDAAGQTGKAGKA
jgi:23S rRNA (guanosine2251-2'-O)-methyltransferase